MKNRIQVFGILSRVGFLKLSKYIEATLVKIFSSLIFILVQFFLWQAIINNSINVTYSFYQMFTYVVCSQLLSNIYPNGIGRQFGQLIKTGDISLYLLKPLSISRQLVYENIGTSVYNMTFIIFPVIVFSVILSNNNLCIYNVPIFIGMLGISYMIFALLDIIFGILQFYTKSSWGINSFKYAIITLFSGRLLPIELYPKAYLSFLNVLPFRFLYDVPIQILIDEQTKDIKTEFFIGCIWIVILYLVYKICFNKAIKKITVHGG